MSHLWDAFFERIAGAGAPPPGWTPPELFGLPCDTRRPRRSPSSTHLAAPATLDMPPLDIGIEDHATGAPLAVRKTGEALDLLQQILSIEVLMANDVIDTAQVPASPLGTGTGALSATGRAAIDGLGDDRSPAEVQRRVAAAMFDAVSA